MSVKSGVPASCCGTTSCCYELEIDVDTAAMEPDGGPLCTGPDHRRGWPTSLSSSAAVVVGSYG